MAKPKTAPTGQIVPKSTEAQKQPQPQGSIVSLLQRDATQREIARALPRHLEPQRMIRVMITAVRQTKNLHLCTPISFFGCMIQAAQLGLEPNTPLGHCYLIPRKRRAKIDGRWCDVHEATFMLGYQGMVELAYRSGRVAGVYAHAVHDGDEFDRQLGLHPVLLHRPSDDPDREQKPLTHVYAVARLRDAEPVFEALSFAQIEARRARSSDSSGKGPWNTDYIAMAKKTALRALWPWIPKSSEMAIAESLEARAEAGKSQISALDESVTQTLEKLGYTDEENDGENEPEPPPESEAEQAEVIDVEAKTAEDAEMEAKAKQQRELARVLAEARKVDAKASQKVVEGSPSTEQTITELQKIAKGGKK